MTDFHSYLVFVSLRVLLPHSCNAFQLTWIVSLHYLVKPESREYSENSNNNNYY